MLECLGGGGGGVLQGFLEAAVGRRHQPWCLLGFIQSRKVLSIMGQAGPWSSAGVSWPGPRLVPAPVQGCFEHSHKLVVPRVNPWISTGSVPWARHWPGVRGPNSSPRVGSGVRVRVCEQGG